MKTAVRLMTIVPACVELHGQGLRTPKPFPPDIPPAAITVNGLRGTGVTLTAADLDNLPQQTVKTADHGTPVTFEGVLLNDVLAKVATPAGADFNKTVASHFVVAEARDEYRAIFSWAEIDPTFTDRKIYIVTRRDGKPLSDKDGPFELIVPGEKRNSRWVRQLTGLRIEAAAKRAR